MSGSTSFWGIEDPFGHPDCKVIVNYLFNQDDDGRYDYFVALYQREQPVPALDERGAETDEHRQWRTRRAIGSAMILDRGYRSIGAPGYFLSTEVIHDFWSTAVDALDELYPVSGAPEWVEPENIEETNRVGEMFRDLARRVHARRPDLGVLAPVDPLPADARMAERVTCGLPVAAANGAPCILYHGHVGHSHCRSG